MDAFLSVLATILVIACAIVLVTVPFWFVYLGLAHLFPHALWTWTSPLPIGPMAGLWVVVVLALWTAFRR